MIETKCLVNSDKEIDIEYPKKAKAMNIYHTLAVGIINKKTKKGYLGHFDPSGTSYEKFIDRIIDETQDINALEVVIAGNHALTRQDIKHALEFYKKKKFDKEKKVFGCSEQEIDKELENLRQEREYKIKYLKSKGITNIRNELLEDPSKKDYQMTVDTETGEIRVEIQEQRCADIILN